MNEKVAYKNVGKPNSETLKAYLDNGGYKMLSEVVRMRLPADVISEIKASGLKGCGGAGFPTGTKWEFVAQVKASPKYVICNADEGEPGTFKDRIILEEDPHLLLEGIAIAGFAVGAETGYIYIRGEFTLGWRRLRQAIEEANRYGALGRNIFGSGFNFNIILRRGAGAYICGEETALIESLEGKRGVPRLRPPYPTTNGLFGKPTLVNNVETLARVPTILTKGPEWYQQLGKDGAAGTKIYCVSGHVARPGAYEMPFGITAGELIYECGVGIKENRELKAFSPGGLSSGFLPASMTDVPLNFEALAKAGSMLGSGAMVVFDDSVCMVDIALRAARFFMHESCGECTPCRIGNLNLVQILEKISRGQGTWEDVSLAEELGKRMGVDSRCGLGQAAASPFLSSLKYFRKEYQAHIEDKECPLNMCKMTADRIPSLVREVRK